MLEVLLRLLPSTGHLVYLCTGVTSLRVVRLSVQDAFEQSRGLRMMFGGKVWDQCDSQSCVGRQPRSSGVSTDLRRCKVDSLVQLDTSILLHFLG